MKIAVFSSHDFEKESLTKANEIFAHDLHFFPLAMNKDSAILAAGYDCVSVFTSDKMDAGCLSALKEFGVKLIALRSAGFNHIDLRAARKLDLPVVRVPEYSPFAVAEYALSLMLTLNRKTHKAYNRVRDLNFSLEGLVGFDMHGKTVGIIGTGRIGAVLAEIVNGFGCRILASDVATNEDLIARFKVKYVTQTELFEESDIISLHVPLNDGTHHLIDEKALSSMKKGIMLVNTGRGGLIDTQALIQSLKSGHIGSAGLDVYEEEEGVFFNDHSTDILQDDVLARLLTFPNVFISSHQGFLTQDALRNIAHTTLESVSDFEKGRELHNRIELPKAEV